MRHSILRPLSLLLPKTERRLARDYRLIGAAGLFDPAWYRQRYQMPDGKDPLWYFLRHGAAQGHAPNPALSDLRRSSLLVLAAQHGKAGKALQRYLSQPPAGDDSRPLQTAPGASEAVTFETVLRALAPIDPVGRRPGDATVAHAGLAALVAHPRLDLFVIDHDMGGGANLYRRRLIAKSQASGLSVGLLTCKVWNGSYAVDILCEGHTIRTETADIADIRSLGRYLTAKRMILNSLVSYKDPIFVADLITDLKEEWQAELSIPLHDFYPVCPSYNLLDWSGQFCRIPELEICRDCMQKLDMFLPQNQRLRDIDRWRKTWGDLLDQATEITCFSISSAELLKRAFPHLDVGRITVQPHSVTVQRP